MLIRFSKAFESARVMNIGRCFYAISGSPDLNIGVTSARFSLDGKRFSFRKELNKEQKCSARTGAPSFSAPAGILDGSRGLFLSRFLQA